jgi:excisionase family DNA binding protein
MGAHPITLHLPDPLYDHLASQAERGQRSLEAEVLRIVAMAARFAVLAPDTRDVSLEEAAALLNLSRSSVVKLLEAGELPHRGVDDKRRITLGDLVAYKQRDRARRRRILAQLTAEAQDMGLDY